jgi:hypothetical protein
MIPGINFLWLVNLIETSFQADRRFLFVEEIQLRATSFRSYKVAVFFVARSLSRLDVPTRVDQPDTRLKLHDDHSSQTAEDRTWLTAVAVWKWSSSPKTNEFVTRPSSCRR